MTALHGGLLTALFLGWLTAAVRAQERDPAPRAVDVDVNVTRDAQAAGYFKASDLIGMEVRGTNDEDLGEVQDLLIDQRTHEVQYLILDTGLFADLGGRQPIVPWLLVDTHATTAERAYLTVPLTQERMKSAPQIDISKAELTRSAAWINQVDEFYGAELKERRVSRPDLSEPGRPGATPRQPAEREQAPQADQPQRPNQPRSETPAPRRGAKRGDSGTSADPSDGNKGANNNQEADNP